MPMDKAGGSALTPSSGYVPTHLRGDGGGVDVGESRPVLLDKIADPAGAAAADYVPTHLRGDSEGDIGARTL